MMVLAGGERTALSFDFQSFELGYIAARYSATKTAPELLSLYWEERKRRENHDIEEGKILT